MNQELNLAAKPKRSSFQREVEQTKQRAFDRSYKQTAKDIAAAEGAAAGAAAAVDGGNGPDGGNASAVERARQRALGEPQAVNPAPRASVQPTKPQSQRIIQQPDGSKVPEAFYDLTPEQQREFKRLVKEQENLASGETHFDQVSLGLIDQLSAQAKRVTNLERLVESLVGENMELRRRQDNIDLSLETTKSDALVEAESQLAQTIVNAGTVKSQLDSSTANSAREMEIQQADHRARFEASERVLGDMEGRLKSTGTLYQERGNAVVSQLVSIEGRVAKTEVTQVELEGRTDALGTPITRDEMRAMVTSTVAAEFPAQLPGMVSKELAIQRRTGELGEGIEIDRGYLAQSLENSDERSKRFDVSQKQIDESKFTNPTERAIRRALKKRGRG